ncbi:carbohydrate-binding module family 18 protein [Piromyces sp. E2]|nr:carbohydrate-binding module family 18 protein [Piromyces sp. E2]|eukprot:OUM57277.1 carbohydrate-binding module family 18 protein [Piromyces sp. E2]
MLVCFLALFKKNCSKYHLDLGKETFEKLLPLTKGKANVIWGIYSEDGEEKMLMYDKSNSKSEKTAQAFDVSLDELVSTFSAEAKDLAKSGTYETYISINTNPIKQTLPTNRDRCGAGVEVCPEGYCCSQYGWCGKSTDHCGTSCQNDYGDCNYPSSFTSDNDRCGPGYGPCKNGLCCNKYGWCTSDPTDCQGCQKGYGVCI